MQNSEIRKIIEALLFSSPEPLTQTRVNDVFNPDTPNLKEVIDGLNKQYAQEDHAFEIKQVAGGYQLVSRAEYEHFIRLMLSKSGRLTLSPAALDSLAIIAYKQPVTRADIEIIRGVNSDGVVAHLLEKELNNIRSDHESDLRTKSYLEKKNIKDNSECERPNFTDGPLQCFENKGYASKEKIFFTGDIMHNKFFIIDKRFIWTGSTNISNTGTGGYNANIVAELDSVYFAGFYTQEF